METYQLVYLKAIVEQRSYSKAANSLFVTQPTISTAIKKLETELGVTLLKREKKDILLTEIGEQIYPKCLRILQEYTDIYNTAHAYKDDSRPPLRIIIPYFLYNRFILLSKTLFTELLPDVALEISSIGILADAQYNEHIQKGDFDLMVNSKQVSLPEQGVYESCPYRKMEYFLYLPKDHPLAQYGEISPEMLKGEQLLSGGRKEGSRKALGNFFDAYFSRFAMSDILTGENRPPDVTMHLISNGLGLALLPKQEPLPENITYRSLNPRLEDELIFVYPKQMRNNADCMRLINILLDLNR